MSGSPQKRTRQQRVAAGHHRFHCFELQRAEGVVAPVFFENSREGQEIQLSRESSSRDELVDNEFMISIELSEALAAFEDLIARVERGETVTITRSLRPVAELSPAGESRDTALRAWGLYAGQFTVPDDFSDPLPDDLLGLFEGQGEEHKD